MSFKQYLQEREELQVQELEKSKRDQVAEFIRTIEDLNDQKFHDFAVNELGMEESEAESLAYKMLRDFLLAGDKDEDGIPDELLGSEEGSEEGSDEFGDDVDGEIEDREIEATQDEFQ